MCLTEFDEEKYKKIVFDDGRIFTIYELAQDGDISLEKGAEKLNMSVSDFVKAMEDNGFKVPMMD